MIGRDHEAQHAQAPSWRALDGVHALTDVTGFGLAGHALELARGAKRLRAARLAGRAAAARRARAGHAGRRDRRQRPQLGWPMATKSSLPRGLQPNVERALLTDPQTSGGLLVSCSQAALARGAGHCFPPPRLRAGSAGGPGDRGAAGLNVKA
jgi:selenide,water dikinase